MAKIIIPTPDFSKMIGRRYGSNQTKDCGTVLEVKKQPRSLVFMKASRYRKEYHVLMKMDEGNSLAATSGYPLSLFNSNFVEVL